MLVKIQKMTFPREFRDTPLDVVFFGIPGVGAIVRGRRGLPAHVATCAGCRNTCTAEAVECTVIGGDAGVSSFFLGGQGVPIT